MSKQALLVDLAAGVACLYPLDALRLASWVLAPAHA
jgi:hypothetical protein